MAADILNESGSQAAGQAGTAAHALLNLAELLDRLRLMYLRFVVVTVVDPWSSAVIRADDLGLADIAPQDIANGRLTYQQRAALAEYERRGIERLGSGSGIRTSIEDKKIREEDGIPVVAAYEVEYPGPFCELPDVGCTHLESMSSKIIDACKDLVAADRDCRFLAIEEKAASTAYANGSEWDPVDDVPWRYLADLKRVTGHVRAAAAAAAQIDATAVRNGSSAASRSEYADLLEALKQHRAWFLKCAVAMQEFYNLPDHCGGIIEVLYLGGDIEAHAEDLARRFGYPDGAHMYQWIGPWKERPLTPFRTIDFESDQWQKTYPFWNVSVAAARHLEASALRIEPLLIGARGMLGAVFERLARAIRNGLPKWAVGRVNWGHLAELDKAISTVRLGLATVDDARRPAREEAPGTMQGGQRTLPAEGKARPKTDEELQVRATDYLKKYRDREDTDHPVTSRELAKAIGCAHGRISKLPQWRALMGRRRERKGPAKPRGVTFSQKLECNTDETGRIGKNISRRHRDDDDDDEADSVDPTDDDELDRLTREQEEDDRTDNVNPRDRL